MLRRGRDILRIAGLLAAAALALPAAAGAATFTVNDDTTGPGPAGADCGARDFSTIQSALNFAAGLPDGGADDLVLVCAGLYEELVSIPSPADGIVLRGAQAGVDARTRNVPIDQESVIDGVGTADNGFVVNADGVTIDGFDYEEDDTGNGGIQPVASSGGHQFVNNIFRSNSFGLRADNDPAVQTVIRHNLIGSNSSAGPVPAGTGIFGQSVSNVLIDENRFSGHADAAINLNPGGAGAEITISDNDLIGDAGTLLSNTANAALEENAITGSLGSAIVLDGDTDVTIERNTISGATANGSAVRLFGAPSGDVSVLSNSITGNAFGIRADSIDGDLQAHFNRIAGNGTGAQNDDLDAPDFIAAQNNWWGCSEGPGQPGCDTASNNVVSSPWLVLGLSASPTSITATGTSQITASLTRNSDNVSVGAGFPNGTPVAFSATLGTVGSPGITSGGATSTTFTAAGQSGTGTVTAALDNEATQTALSIGAAGAATEAAARPKKCKKKKFREKHPKLCGKKAKDKKRKRP